MNITDYKKVKNFDTLNSTQNVKVEKINGTPALTIKKHDPDTGADTGDSDQMGIDVKALELRVADLRAQIDNISELITDAKAVMK